MRFLLDTNVISELVKPRPNEAVAAWIRARSALDLALSVLTLGELEHGIQRLAGGARRRDLSHWARVELPTYFDQRIVAVDARVAQAWGRLTAAGRRTGRPLPVVDGLLLATAAVHDLTLVTRNLNDCAGRGIPLHDPWTGTSLP